MTELKTSRVLLITIATVAFIGFIIICAPHQNVKAEETALYSPGITIEKVFRYEWLMAGIDWTDHIYLQGLEVDVTYLDCNTFLGTYTTDEWGSFIVDGVPAGTYLFEWECGGVFFESKHYVCCNADYHKFTNLIPPKGEQRATSSFSFRVHLLSETSG